ncbi:MAG: hypothetical protein ACJ76X_01825 [Solirubrobacteraceae bacterium]|jgi:hypothetical protein
MATRIVFTDGRETVVSESESDIAMAVRRDHPNPVRLEGEDGLVVYINRSNVELIAPKPDPALR